MAANIDALQQTIASVALIAGERSFSVRLEWSTIWKKEGELSWYAWVADVGNASGPDVELVLRKLRAQAAAIASIDATPEPSNALIKTQRTI